MTPASAFKAIDTFGNANLQPESAFTYNIGALLDIGGFSASIDYWSFDFEDPVAVEPFDAILATVLANCASTNPAQIALRNRVSFASNVCAGANVQRVSTNIINGPAIRTSGVDASAEYAWQDFLGGELTLGGSVTWLEKYEIDPLSVEGVQLTGTQDLAGFLNRGTGYRSMPELKGEVFGNFNVGNHNIRWIARYIDEYTDQRTAPFAVRNSDLANTAVLTGKTIESQWTHDVHYVWETPWGSRLSASVNNVFDEDPPLARLDLNFDPYTHNPLGRTFRIGLTHRFGAGS